MSQAHLPQSDLFRAVFDASPTAMLVVDDDVAVQDFNQATALLLGEGGEDALFKRGGEVLHCLHAYENPAGCGRAPACRDCVVRQAVNDAMAGRQALRRLAAMELLAEGKKVRRTFLVSASPFAYLGRSWVLLGLEDISELVALRDLLPICANCKKIRDDENFWVSVETYFERYLGAEFTHGLCPDCIKQLYPDLTAKS